MPTRSLPILVGYSVTCYSAVGMHPPGMLSCLNIVSEIISMAIRPWKNLFQIVSSENSFHLHWDPLIASSMMHKNVFVVAGCSLKLNFLNIVVNERAPPLKVVPETPRIRISLCIRIRFRHVFLGLKGFPNPEKA